MDFQQLLSKMREIDQPQVEQVAQECGMPMGQMSPPPVDVKPDVPPPSLSVNINAHGMDDIEDMMKLLTKVNPDMINQPVPPAPPMASMIAIKPSLPPLKPLPDFDADNDDMVGGEKDMLPPDHDKDHAMVKKLDLDMDGDHDMDDHDLEKKEDGGFQAATTEPDPEFKNADYMLNRLAGGMNRPKDTFPKVADGDNPMKKVREGDDFKEQIKSDLRRRLEESKKKTLDEGPMDFVKKAGAAVKGWATGGLAGAKTAMAKQAAGATPTTPAKNSFGKVAKAPAAGGPGVSPAQAAAGAAQQSSGKSITPKMGEALAVILQDAVDAVQGNHYSDVEQLKQDIVRAIDKQANRPDLQNKGAK